jgi:hypothetical protein
MDERCGKHFGLLGEFLSDDILWLLSQRELTDQNHVVSVVAAAVHSAVPTRCTSK